MNLKKIKPGMVVHVKNDEEFKELLKEAKRLGYRWLSGKEIDPEIKDSLIQSYSIAFNEGNDFRYFRNIGFVLSSSKTIEFSDLVLPDLTAEEALDIVREICYDHNECIFCPLNNSCYRSYDTSSKEIVKKISQYKADNEKKEPEIETVYICRIIEIHPDGKKRCVYEEDLMKIEIDEKRLLPLGMKILKKCSEILKNYCMEHEGDFIAVHETVCRVKR